MRTKLSHEKYRKISETPKKIQVASQESPCISQPPKEILTESEFDYEYKQFTIDLPIHQEAK